MPTVKVTIGVGAWIATASVNLVACPHVGDFIIVGEHVITCEKVYIGPKDVQVSQSYRFQSEQDAFDFFKDSEDITLPYRQRPPKEPK